MDLSPHHFSPGILKTGMFILSMMRSQTLHNGLKAQCGLAPTYLSTSLLSLLLTNMHCQTPPPITLAAFWLYTPKHSHLRKFIPAIFPCLEHSSQYLQILLALSVRITSRAGKLVLFICNSKPGAPSQSLPGRQPHPPLPRKNGSKKSFPSQAENWKMSCLVCLDWCLCQCEPCDFW